MSRLSDRLQALAKSERKALVTFITAGDPDLDATVPALHALVAGGADIGKTEDSGVAAYVWR